MQAIFATHSSNELLRPQQEVFLGAQGGAGVAYDHGHVVGPVVLDETALAAKYQLQAVQSLPEGVLEEGTELQLAHCFPFQDSTDSVTEIRDIKEIFALTFPRLLHILHVNCGILGFRAFRQALLHSSFFVPK